MYLSELIIKADSLLGDAYMDRVHVTRINADFSSKLIKVNLNKVLEGNPDHDIILKGLDLVRIYGINEMPPQKYITINGIVRSPNTYKLKTNMTLNDLILEAGGFSKDCPKYQIEIARIDPKKVNENNYAETFITEITDTYSIINFETSPNAIGELNTEFILEPYDYISVRPDPFFKMHRTVEITGSVYYPGVYALKNPEENITDIINRAGGLLPKAYAEASTMMRKGMIIRMNFQEIIDKPRSNKNIIMQSGDKIMIAVKPNITQILGEISSPGVYKYIPGKRVNDYLAMAGGLSMNAEKKDIWITFSDGQSQRYKRWRSNPIVRDGSIITVGREAEKEPFDGTEFAKEIASIMSDLAQVAVLIIITTGQ